MAISPRPPNTHTATQGLLPHRPPAAASWWPSGLKRAAVTAAPLGSAKVAAFLKARRFHSDSRPAPCRPSSEAVAQTKVGSVGLQARSVTRGASTSASTCQTGREGGRGEGWGVCAAGRVEELARRARL